MFFDTEDTENSYDNCGYTNALSFFFIGSHPTLSVSKVPVSSVSRNSARQAALIREIVRALISVKPMSVPIFSPYPSFMFSMPSGSR